MERAWCDLCDLPPAQCGHSIAGPSFVYVSGGGSCYHSMVDCPALVEGQDEAERQGMRRHEVTSVAMARAVEMGREACAVCFDST